MKYKNAFKTQEGKEEVLKQYDMLLEAPTIPHERFYVNTRHGSTFCIAAGDINNPPMLLLHGSSMNSMELL